MPEYHNGQVRLIPGGERTIVRDDQDVRPPTGGELESLWRVANVQLPELANRCIAQVTAVHRIDDPVNQKTYGKAHHAWTSAARLLERAMYLTANSLAASSRTLNRAIEDYTYVDGDTAGELTEIGKSLDRKIDDSDRISIDEYDEGYNGPNIEKP